VSAVSPSRAAGFLLMKTVELPWIMVPLLLGGLTKAVPGGVGRCGGVSSATLNRMAAGRPMIFTFALSDSWIIPVKGCGNGVGMGGPIGVGTSTMWTSVAKI